MKCKSEYLLILLCFLVVGCARREVQPTLYPEILDRYEWDEGLRELTLQVIRPLPAEGVVRISVGRFLDAREGKQHQLSQRVRSDIQILLANVEGISVMANQTASSTKEIPEYLLTGLYRIEQDGVRINATLMQPATHRIISSGRVLIQKEAIRSHDIQEDPDPRLSQGQQEAYPEGVDILLSSQPMNAIGRVELQSDKGAYRHGEEVYFTFSVTHDAYVTLIDVGTSGKVSVLFPNFFYPDSFVKAGKVYSLPPVSTGFRIHAEGPPGLERIKAMATATPSPIVRDGNRFCLVACQGMTSRDFQRLGNRFEEESGSEGYLEIYITEEEHLPFGQPRRIKPKKPIKPIDIIGVPGVKTE